MDTILKNFYCIVCAGTGNKDLDYNTAIACMRTFKLIQRTHCCSTQIHILLELIIEKSKEVEDLRLHPILLSMFVNGMSKCTNWYIKTLPNLNESSKEKRRLDDYAEMFQETAFSSFMFNQQQIELLKKMVAHYTIIEVGADGVSTLKLLTAERLNVRSDNIHKYKVEKSGVKRIGLASYAPNKFLNKFRYMIQKQSCCLMVLFPMRLYNYDINALTKFEELGGNVVIFGGSYNWCGSEDFLAKLELDYVRIGEADGSIPMPLVSDDSPVEGLFLESQLIIYRKKTANTV